MNENIEAMTSKRDERIHVEYVPTQVVTEYLRRIFRTTDDDSVFGLAFTSSREGTGQNIVLFLDRDQCLDAGEVSAAEPTVEMTEFCERPGEESGAAGSDAG